MINKPITLPMPTEFFSSQTKTRRFDGMCNSVSCVLKGIGRGGSKVNFWNFLCFNTAENLDYVTNLFTELKNLIFAQRVDIIWVRNILISHCMGLFDAKFCPFFFSQNFELLYPIKPQWKNLKYLCFSRYYPPYLLTGQKLSHLVHLLKIKLPQSFWKLNFFGHFHVQMAENTCVRPVFATYLGSCLRFFNSVQIYNFQIIPPYPLKVAVN